MVLSPFYRWVNQVLKKLNNHQNHIDTILGVGRSDPNILTSQVAQSLVNDGQTISLTRALPYFSSLFPWLSIVITERTLHKCSLINWLCSDCHFLNIIKLNVLGREEASSLRKCLSLGKHNFSEKVLALHSFLFHQIFYHQVIQLKEVYYTQKSRK